jgi:hypothetical protein
MGRLTMTSRTLQRRSIVMMLPLDDKTSDEITDGVIAFIKSNYNVKAKQIEANKRTVFVKNYIEVDEK